MTFEEPITKWETTLATMSEIIELALAVQRQWYGWVLGGGNEIILYLN